MDPLTHTLVGANLAATRLGARTRFAAAALIIGANLPDIDAVTYLMDDSDFALGVRRGWTHGVLALAVLPFLQTGLLLLIDRMWPDRTRATNPRWLLLLSVIGICTHPALDWLNTYGIRLLMPFSGTWFYGDSVYIIDPWLWLVLGIGWLAGRRPTVGVLALWAAFTFMAARVVFQRSPDYLPIIGALAVVLLATLLWRWPAASERRIQRFATASLVLAVLYIGSRVVIHDVTERRVETRLAQLGVTPIDRLMVSPKPLDPKDWDFVAQSNNEYRFGHFDWSRGLDLQEERMPVAKDSPEWRTARADPSVCGFMTWVRFPAYEVERKGDETRVILYDARRMGRPGRGGRVVVLLGSELRPLSRGPLQKSTNP